MQLTFDHVTKFYGPVIGVNDIHCQIGPGITALFGTNGAGKSTMMRLAGGQLHPSLGQVRLGPDPAWSARAKAHLGYCPDIDRFYSGMTGRQFVYTMARLSGLSVRQAKQRTEQVLSEVGMEQRAGRQIAGYSRGMRQRVKLAQALVHDPQVLLLDEPLDGVDPGGRRELTGLFVRLAEAGKTVLVSTHILYEVESLAERIMVIVRGRIAAQGTIREIRSMLANRALTIEIDARPSRLLAARLIEGLDLESIEFVRGAIRARTREPSRLFAMVRDQVADGTVEVERLEVVDAGAEAVFDYLQAEAS